MPDTVHSDVACGKAEIGGWPQSGSICGRVGIWVGKMIRCCASIRNEQTMRCDLFWQTTMFECDQQKWNLMNWMSNSILLEWVRACHTLTHAVRSVWQRTAVDPADVSLRFESFVSFTFEFTWDDFFSSHKEWTDSLVCAFALWNLRSFFILGNFPMVFSFSFYRSIDEFDMLYWLIRSYLTFEIYACVPVAGPEPWTTTESILRICEKFDTSP